MMYNSLGEYERMIRKQFLDSQGRPIESHPVAFMALAASIAALDETLQEAKESGEPQTLRSEATGKVGIICYPTGEIEFVESGDERGFLTIKREQRRQTFRDQEREKYLKEYEEQIGKKAAWELKYTEMTWEERVRFAKMEPISMDDVLDIHKFLRDFEGNLSEHGPPENSIIKDE